MRILLLGRFRPERWVRLTTEELFARAFDSLGCEIVRQEIRDGEEDALKAVSVAGADWVFVSKDFGMGVGFIQRLRSAAPKARFAHWHFDSMYALGKLKWYEKIAPLFDVAFTKEKGLLEEFRKKGINGVYFDQGIDPEVTRPGLFRPSLSADVGFLGTYYEGNERFKLLKGVSENFALRIWSQKPHKWKQKGFESVEPPLFDEQVGDVCASVKILLGINITHRIAGYWSNRHYLVTGAGGFYLCKYTPGLEEVFKNREHLVWFESIDEAIRLIRFYLSNESERKRIAKNGMELTRSCYTYKQRAEHILKVLSSFQ
ncbi:MAG: glycosyltransferase [Planctomycetota bacterium]|nr:glycosyltransferase [Planctomycetota bacterium]